MAPYILNDGWTRPETESQNLLATSTKLRAPSVLIVEDDMTMEPLWRYIIQEVDPNAQIKWATTEELAERLIRRKIRMHEDFDLIICDVFLNGTRTGIDLWKRYGDGPSPFLFMSVISQSKLAKLTGTMERMPRYLQKPLNPVKCIEIVGNMLNYERPLN